MPDAFNKTLRFLAAYLADIGRVGVPCCVIILAAIVCLEFFVPGIAGNYVATQYVAAGLLVFGALTLLADAPAASHAQRSIDTLVCAGVAALTLMVAARWFAPLPDAAWLTTGAVTAVLFVFLALGRATRK